VAGESTVGVDKLSVYEYDQPDLSNPSGSPPATLPTGEHTITLASPTISPPLTSSGCPTYTVNTAPLKSSAHRYVQESPPRLRIQARMSSLLFRRHHP